MLISFVDIVIAILMFANCFAVKASVGLSFIICIRIEVRTSGKAFFGCPRGLSLLINSLYLKFDWMGYLISSLTPYLDLLIYMSVAISSFLFLVSRYGYTW